MRIIQIVGTYDYGDGIGNDIKHKRAIFEKLGYKTELYAIMIDPRLKHLCKHLDELKVEPDDIVFHHYSGHFAGQEKIWQLNCKKVMVYHNITPPKFLDGPVRVHCEDGIKQLRTLKGCYDYYVGDSKFNVDCLKEAGVCTAGEVLPIIVEFDKKTVERKKKADDEQKNFLFVGRMAQNKKIEDIIKVFDAYHTEINSNSALYLPGNLRISEEYTAKLFSLKDSLPSRDSIYLPGKVSDEDLMKLYASADMYISMSEHEGFGIPLLEAMNYRIPVLAYDSSAIAETMGSSGVLVKTKDPVSVARIMHEVLSDKALLDEITDAQLKNLNRFTALTVEKKIESLINRIRGIDTCEEEEQSEKLSVQMQGPFETSYSLAIVNRKLAEAMNKAGCDMSIRTIEGMGEYTPDPANLEDKPVSAMMYHKGQRIMYPDVTIRNMFPPNTQPVLGKYNFQAFGWEEDRIPVAYLEWFNRELDGIGTMSDFVTQTLKDSGVTVPVKTMGIGVELPDDFEDIPAYELATDKKVKLLHISSCFPRKGVDVLLKAYFEEFTADDDVVLVIKTFPNPHNKTEQQIDELKKKHPNAPKIILINRDLPEKELFSLYKACDCYVHTARGEGFGLPAAEAMLAKIPVIVSANTGLKDFCNENTAILVDYKMVKAKSHVSENSRWAEPDGSVLRKKLRAFYDGFDTADHTQMLDAAYKNISENFNWDVIAKRWDAFIKETVEAKKLPKVGLVTTWNTKCGIAEFSRYYYDESKHLADFTVFPDRSEELLREDELFVAPRTWEQYDKYVGELSQAIMHSDCEYIHIQYNFAFYTIGNLAALLDIIAGDKKVIVHLHAAKYLDQHVVKENRKYVAKNLNKSHAIIVHQAEEIQYLTKHGVKKELIHVMPHGQITFAEKDASDIRRTLGIDDKSPVIASFGFLLPHKGVKKTIEAIALLKDKYPNILYIASCAIFDRDESRDFFKECMETVKQKGLDENVVMIPDFLPADQSMKLMQAADICVMAYDKTGEAASGAIRFCAGALRPIITTQQDIFKEFADCSLQIPSNEPELIAEAIEKLIEPAVYDEYAKKTKAMVSKTAWRRVARQYASLYKNKLD